jgi:hypothetical protein
MASHILASHILASHILASHILASHILASHITDPDNREIYFDFIRILFNQTKTIALSDERLSLDKAIGITYPEVETMAFHLSIQLQYLEDKGFSLLFWQPSDILVLHNTTGQKLYLLVNLTQMVPLDKKKRNELVLIYPTVFPFPKERCAPELLKMNALPFRTHRSASYYSLAMLCLLYLSLDEIKGSRLFYFLERCLQVDPNERTLLYI